MRRPLPVAVSSEILVPMGLLDERILHDKEAANIT
jgi:hypothetical protein